MEYWYLWLILALLFIVTILVMTKASKALQLHNNEKNDTIEQLKKLKALKDEFINLTKEKAESEDAPRLFEGVMAVFQYEIEKSEDAEKLFSEYKAAKKAVYTISYIIEDGEKELSNFFKRNGEPLVSNAENALSIIGETSLADIAKEEFSMFDENNEDISIDNEKLKELDEKFLKDFDKEKIMKEIKELIVSNINEF
ncbi:MAG: hypothetical protein RR239_01370 [Oscillospiraceae bacterium]